MAKMRLELDRLAVSSFTAEGGEVGADSSAGSGDSVNIYYTCAHTCYDCGTVYQCTQGATCYCV